MSCTFSIWKDQIILRWDGTPPNGCSIPANLLQSEPELVLSYWNEIGPYTRYSKRLHGFFMSFSKQNLQRLRKQFGEINIEQGFRALNDIKSSSRDMAALFRQVDLIKNGNVEDICYKLPPLGEYQHIGVNLLTRCKRVPLFADCGCIYGLARIPCYLDGEYTELKMYDLYKQFNSYKKVEVLSFTGKKIERHKINKVVSQGCKLTRLLELENGKSIFATWDHEIMTDSGWVPMQIISVANKVLTYSRENGMEFSPVRSNKKCSIKMDVYDIVCEDPHRNFVANGIVVHNCGKTYMALVSTQEQYRRGLLTPGKTLVIGKLATLFTGWKEDCSKFTHMKCNVVWVKAGTNRKAKLLEILNDPADIYVINHDGARVLEEELAQKKFEKIVLDESTILKGFMGERFGKGAFGKALMNIAPTASWRVIMSGTPAPNGPQDLWGQFHFLDPEGLLLEKTIHDFRRSFMEEVFFGKPDNPNTPKTWVPKEDAADKVGNLINPLAYRVRIRDHLKDLPEKTVVRRICSMGGEQKTHYHFMENTMMTQIDGELVAVSIALAKLSKLRQITSGFLLDQETEAHPFSDNPKLELLDDLLLDEINQEDKVVIYAQHRWEIEMLASRYKDMGVCTVYGGNAAHVNLSNIDRFISDPKLRIVILHPKSAAHGITFVVSHYMIFYSISYSAEDDYQCVARIERAGQKHPMFIYYLLCEDSIDMDIYEVLQSKKDNQQDLIDADIVTRIRNRAVTKPRKRKRGDNG